MTFRGLGIWDLGIIGLGFVSLGRGDPLIEELRKWVRTYAAAPAHGPSTEGAGTRERVLFIGTQFSILYTSMYSPGGAAGLWVRQ
jgi:hypothetical protein